MMNTETTNTNTSTPVENQKTNLLSKLKNIKALKPGNSKLNLNFKALVAVFGLLFLAFAVYAGKGFFIPAVVNGKPITRLAVISELERRNGQQVVEGLVNQALIEQEAKARGVTVTEADIDADIQIIDGNMKAQGSSIDEALQAQSLSMKDFRELLRANKMLEKLIADKVAVTEEEITAYFDGNKASFPEGSTLDQVREQIRPFLQQQKVETESAKLFEELMAKSKIYFWKKY